MQELNNVTTTMVFTFLIVNLKLRESNAKDLLTSKFTFLIVNLKRYTSNFITVIKSDLHSL